jgi:ABC-2 type transport system ATP-binding protein
MSPELEAHGVSKAYGSVIALHDVSIAVPSGSVTCLIGRNGAGKTTLIEILSGLRRPDTGVVSRPGPVSLAPQETAVYPELTVEANLAWEAQLCGMSKREARAVASEVAEVFELTDHFRMPTGRLSGGGQRRVHLAMTFVRPVDWFILDEPTVGLDIASRARVMELLGKLRTLRSCGILMTTHYAREVENVADDVVILHAGRVARRGSLRSLLAQAGDAVLDIGVAHEAQARKLAHHACGVAGVRRAYATSTRVHIEVDGEPESVVAALRRSVAGRDLADVRLLSMDLEALFLLETAEHPDPDLVEDTR